MVEWFQNEHNLVVQLLYRQILKKKQISRHCIPRRDVERVTCDVTLR
jgi:hypothetical protein